MSDDASTLPATDIAIVGLAGHFPGARSPEELWRNVAARVESIVPVTDAELRAAGVAPELLRDPSYVKVTAALQGVDTFDASFFGFSPRDAAILDPQHRHFLECAWEALEDAGHPPERFPGAIGVYAGCGMNAYFAFNLLTNPEMVRSVGLFLLRHTGNDKDFLTTRVSYLLGLTGPSIAVQTACSTSLVAVHLACQQLLARECDMALAGGVTIELPHGHGYRYAEGEILSPDGHCRAFDARAQGTVFGSGAGVVVLRRLDDALADGDHVYAVIKGSAVNNDGSGKVGYLAPSVDGQAAAVREAIDIAGVTADRIGYVEAHGTGTPVGDPIEIAALTEAFRATTADTGFCAIGSLKTNIGHLDTAAGVAGLIKVVKALEHRALPPSLHFTTPNPAIDFASTPFVVNTTLRPWPGGDRPRLAGVNSLGVGGTNVHVIVEEAPPEPARPAGHEYVLLPLSARTPSALARQAERLADHLAATPALRLDDVAHTLQVGRRTFDHRRTVAARTLGDAVERLRATDRRGAVDRPAAATPPAVLFMFPGGGAQYPGMARELFREAPVFREVASACVARIRAAGGPDLVPAVFEAPDDADAEAALARPLLSVLSVFVVEVALAAQYRAWGVVPSAVIGHSLGEYAAAHLAGVMSLDDAIAIVMARGRLFEQAPPGAMLSVALDRAALEARLPDGATIAAMNGPALMVASGARHAIDALERQLAADGVECQRVRIDVAAHSALLDPFLADFEAFASTLRLSPPVLPFLSNVTGTWAGGEVATAAYWTRHLRQPVRFADGIAAATRETPTVCLEVGPGRALSSFVRQSAPRVATAGSMRHRHDAASDIGTALEGAGALWAAGVPLDWTRLPGAGQGRRVPLPTYPFERTRHWIEPGRLVAAGDEAPALPRATSLDGWWWTPGWHAREVAASAEPPVRRIVWLAHADGRSAPFVEALQRRGHEVRTLVSGREIDVQDADACAALVAAEAGASPTTIVFDAFTPDAPFEPAFHLVRGLGAAEPEMAVTLAKVTRGLWSVDGQPSTGDPRQALALGPFAVLPREYPVGRTTAIDVPVGPPSSAVLARFVAEIEAGSTETRVALRDEHRWVAGYTAATPPAPTPTAEGARGATLITGAFGGVGRLVARWAAERHRGRLLLLGRRSPRHVDTLLADLRARGADPAVIEVDLADADAVRAAVSGAGRIARVYHLAGRIDDAPLASKSLQGCHAVLAPKVDGTRHLAAALAADPPETFVCFSSTSAFLGLPGQSDYAAANLFLAAFTDSAEGRRVHARTVYWGAWQNRGMTAQRPAALPAAGAHPLLGPLAAAYDDEWVFDAQHADTSWWYDEHRTVQGTAVCPGTAFLELLHAAGRAVLAGAAFHLGQVTFLRPLELPRGGSRRVTTRATRSGGVWNVTVASVADGATSVVQHVAATLVPGHPEAATVDVAAVQRRCDRRTLDRQAALAPQQAHIAFGPRWRALGTVRLGESEAIATLSLPPAIRADLSELVLHPALLDVAIAAAVGLVPGHDSGGLLVPFSAERAYVVQPLSGDAVAHAQLRLGTSALMGYVDLVVADASGAPCYVVENLALRRVDGAALQHLQQGTTQPAPPTAVLVQQGIRDEEGLAALPLALDAAAGAHLLVSPFAPADLHAAVERWWPAQTPRPRQRTSDAPPAATGAGQPSLEHEIGAIWSDLLGVDAVGLDDDFFALGGHSLLGVRLFSRIERRLGHRLDLSTLFTARTVRAIARHITETTRHEWRALTPIQQEGTRPPFYCVHGVGGEVLAFMDLAAALGPDQPFYGLRAVGLDGASAPQSDVRVQAETYLHEILQAQPDGPYFIGGYSHGARVAYEIACELERRGTAPVFLALIDTWASDQAPRGATWPLRFLANLPAWCWHDVAASSWADNLDRLRRGWLRVRRAFRRAAPADTGSTVAEHMDLRALPDVFRSVFEANFAAFSGYTPGPYRGPVTVFRATAQPLFTPHLPDHGWRQVAPQAEIVRVVGNHFSIVRPPHVTGLAASLRAAMDRAIVRTAAERDRARAAEGTAGARASDTSRRDVA